MSSSSDSMLYYDDIYYDDIYEKMKRNDSYDNGYREGYLVGLSNGLLIGGLCLIMTHMGILFSK